MIKKLLFVFIILISINSYASEFTTNYNLEIPSIGTRDWQPTISNDIISIDAVLNTLSADSGWINSGNNLYTRSSSDNIGLGTSTPTYKLELTNGGISATVGNTTNSVVLDINQNDTTNNPRAVLINNAGTANALKVDQNGASSSSTSVGGAILLENTGNTGAGLVIYSNVGATASGRLLNIRADNDNFDQAALHVDYDGNANAVEIVHNSNTEDAVALTVTETNPNASAVGITSNVKTHGVEKIIHTGTGDDSNASIWSADIQGIGTACQGIFITTTTNNGGTTGDFIKLRNRILNNTEKEFFTVNSTGDLGLNVSSPTAKLSISADSGDTDFIKVISDDTRVVFGVDAINRLIVSSDPIKTVGGIVGRIKVISSDGSTAYIPLYSGG